MTVDSKEANRDRRVVVRDEATETVLHESAEYAATAWSRTLGFMFRDPTDRALVLDLGRTESISIHTFFVRAPLDVLALDYRLEVVASIERLAPFRIWTPPSPVRYLVEFGDRVIARTNPRVGDRLAFAFV